ncbi:MULTISPECIES: polysaccharide lyase 8 family protein [unclassified Streptomyces]|uniref:polysaccharide lyase 8 family protein n=1 Tax=unclassified Streptomyces TaxID=2593676 RepID=UPI00093EB3C2|nr:polysaccharide lyase 8 family protein [Streptomyces sp. CB02058]OKI94608.1 lyase [Streptomyces sp. CB02058]
MSSPLSRRTFVQISGAATAIGLAGLSHTNAVAAEVPSSAADFAALRATWRSLLLGKDFKPTAEPFSTKLAALGAQATAYAELMAPADGSLFPDAVWADPDPDLDTESYTYSSRIQTSFQRLYTMAEAWSQPGTGITGDPSVAAKIVAGLDHMYARIYNEGQPRYGNWYNWQIGGPQALLDTALLVRDELSAEQIAAYCRAVDAFVPDSAVASYAGTSTGANRIDLCRVLAIRGILGEEAAKVALAASAIAPVFPYVTSGDGLYADGSIIQHTFVPYTGSYGAVLLDGLSKLLALLSGSAWETTDPGRQIIFDAVEAAYAPFLHNGLFMDGVSGRATARGLPPGSAAGQNDDQLRGHAIMASVVALGQAASAEENQRWRGLVRGWIQRGSYRSPVTDPMLSVAKLSLLNGVLDDSSVTPLPQPDSSLVFPAMDRAVHRRQDWVASVSMASRRITYYENGNGENLRGWHTGSGMLYWWGGDFANDQFSDRFWPTVDPYRLPGTTASAKRLADGEGGIWGASRPDVDFVGGTGDGSYAVLGQQLKGLSSSLQALKSWFFTDDAVICLGSGISASDGTSVETVVENRHLGVGGTNALTVDGRRRPSAFPWSASIPRAGWAHIAGHGGYVLPERGTLNALREERTGAWRDINSASGSTTPITSRYTTLWFDHGTDPVDEGYAYILLPGASASTTARRAGALGRWLTEYTHTPEVHGVRIPALGLTAANFWAAGRFGGLSVSAPVSVLVRERRDGTAVVCVSDPARLRKSVRIAWDRPVRSVVTRPGPLTDSSTGSGLELSFGDLSSTAGSTLRTTVRLG